MHSLSEFFATWPGALTWLYLNSTLSCVGDSAWDEQFCLKMKTLNLRKGQRTKQRNRILVDLISKIWDTKNWKTENLTVRLAWTIVLGNTIVQANIIMFAASLLLRHFAIGCDPDSHFLAFHLYNMLENILETTLFQFHVISQFLVNNDDIHHSVLYTLPCSNDFLSFMLAYLRRVMEKILVESCLWSNDWKHRFSVVWFTDISVKLKLASYKYLSFLKAEGRRET